MGYFETIYSDDSLPHRAKTVYMYLQDRMDAQQQCWPSIPRIAADLRLSETTVKRALRELENGRYIRKGQRRRENGGYTSNLYTLLY